MREEGNWGRSRIGIERNTRKQRSAGAIKTISEIKERADLKGRSNSCGTLDEIWKRKKMELKKEDGEEELLRKSKKLVESTKMEERTERKIEGMMRRRLMREELRELRKKMKEMKE